MLHRAGVLARFLCCAVALFSAPSSHSISFEQSDEITRSELSSVYSVSALDEPNQMAAHPSGDYLFVASRTSDAVSLFRRQNNSLVFLNSHKDGQNGVDGLNGASAVTVSPDGKFIYVASFHDAAIALFSFDEETESFNYIKHYKQGLTGELGNEITGLAYFWGWGITDVEISPNGDYLFVTSTRQGGAVFKVNKDDGTLSFVSQGFPGYTGGNSSVAASENDSEIAVLNINSDEVVIFQIDQLTGVPTLHQSLKHNQNSVVNLNYPVDAIFNNGLLYVAAANSDAVSVFEKQQDGMYQQIQTITKSSQGNDGQSLTDLDGVRSLAIGVDDRALHVSSTVKDSIVSFELDSATGLLGHFDTSGQGDTLNGVTISGLSDPFDIVAIPGLPLLAGLSKSGDSISLYHENFPGTESIVELVSPSEDGIHILPTQKLKMKAIAYLQGEGNISSELQWWNNQFETIGQGPEIEIGPLVEGTYWFKPYLHDSNNQLIYDKIFVYVSGESNFAPVITSAPPLSAYRTVPYEYQVTATDEQVESITFTLPENPAGMDISPEGLITWTPTELQEGSYNVTVRVTDSQQEFVEQSYVVNVIVPEASYDISFITQPVTQVTVGDVYEYQSIAITDSDTDITYSLSVSPIDMQIDQVAGLIRWNPSSDDVGANPVVLRALDEFGNFIEQRFSVIVTDGLVAPSIVSVPEPKVLEGRLYEYMLEVAPESSGYTYQLESSSSAASIDQFGRIRWSHDSGLANSLVGENNHCAIQPAEASQFDPVLKWHWQGGQVRITPLVGQFSDDNADGQINQFDTPDVVFTSYIENELTQARMVVLDGETGSPLPAFEEPVERFHAYAHIAIGDIDNDGVMDIVTTTTEGEIVAYAHTGGDPKWRVDIPPGFSVRTAPALYDLNGDGSVEILMGKFVFDSTGQLLWEGEGSSTGRFFAINNHTASLHGTNRDFTSFAMDINQQIPGQEVIVGNQVYSAAGDLLWTAEDLGDGPSAIADLDGDGDPELVIMDNDDRFLGVVDHKGKLLWKLNEPFGSQGGPPTLSDINGDGFLEISIVTKGFIYAYSHTGEELWDFAIIDGSSGVTGATVFDFEGDGKADIVYFDEEDLRVFDESGEVKFSIDNISGTWIEYPVIADIDNDGHADIVIPSSDSNSVEGDENQTAGVRAFQDRYNTWPATRSIWNQHAYHIDNINDDGSIPAVPEVSYLTHNTFRLSAYPNRAGKERVDFTLDSLRLNETLEGKVLSVDVVNRTSVFVNEVIDIRFYLGHPDQSVLIGEAQLAGLNRNETKTVNILNVDTTLWDSDIYATLEYNGATPECIESNNSIVATYFRVEAFDDRNRSDSQEFLVSVENYNVAPIIDSEGNTMVVAGNEYLYDVQASDEDLGDMLNYQLMQKPQGMYIGANDGVIQWAPTNQNVGIHDITVRVIDTSGSYVEQNFSVEVVDSETENHPPYITNIKTLYSHGAVSYRLESFDPEGDPVTYELMDGPPYMDIRNINRLYWYHVGSNVDAIPGLYHAKIKVTDEHGLFSVSVIPIWVTEDPVDQDDIDSGEVSPPEIVTLEDKEYVFMVGANNTIALPLPDGVDGYSYELVSGPLFLGVTDNAIHWKPPFIGDYTATVMLTNGTLSYQYTVRLSVRTTTNEHPILSTTGFPSILYVNEPFEYQFTYSDPNSDPVTFEVIHKPSNASIDGDARLTWTPTTNEIGDQHIEILLRDSVGMTDNATQILLEVREFRNRAPSFTQLSPPHYAVVDAPYEYQFLATDPDGDNLTFRLEDEPGSMQVDVTGRIYMANVLESDVDDYEVKVIAEDGNGGSETITYSLSVASNTAPQFTNTPNGAAHVGKTYWYGPRAEDQESHSFTFNWISGPDKAEFDSASGEISWTPTEEQQGPNQIQISVTDQFGETSNQTINVYVYSDQIMYRNVCPAPATLQ